MKRWKDPLWLLRLLTWMMVILVLYLFILTVVSIEAQETATVLFPWESYEITYERDQERPLPKPVVYIVFRSDTLDGDWYQLAETIDTFFVDTISVNHRYYYKVGVRWIDGVELSSFSEDVSGAVIDLTQGIEECWRTVEYDSMDMLAVYYPDGPWEYYWGQTPGDEDKELFVGIYKYESDFDRVFTLKNIGNYMTNGGELFGEEADAVVRMYNKQTVFIIYP